MATAFTFDPPSFDQFEGKWFSQGTIFNVVAVAGVTGFEPADGFNPVRISVPSPSYEVVKSAFVSLAQQVDAKSSSAWAAHSSAAKFDGSGIALPPSP